MGIEENTRSSSTAREHCQACGTCCRKGGPALHHKDRDLVLNGTLPLEHLVTLRAGEPVYDNVTGTYIPADTDIIKICSNAGSTACHYLDSKNNRCRIYSDRPLECRVLECWNTTPLKKIYRQERLTRKDLIADVEGLWGLVCTHQAQCDYERLARMVERCRKTRSQQPDPSLLQMLRYDMALRRLVCEKSPEFEKNLSFLLGLPLITTIRRLGIKLHETGPDQFHLYYL
jgi:Fe-S-cluster containining protein